ncbi:hypothetical protein LSTR_LSTR005025 [Laodelphax striatellus]|uniref:Uncharacterized protein n=1 Tax=Laodelphax striatellus TaxID=195883 RepID=A0A482WTV8_LAOST|nr:hypothetical protein LSTR_LSTR005025 [Laodelphax striatellus]
MSGPPPPRGWASPGSGGFRPLGTPSPVPFRPYTPSPPPIASPRRLPHPASPLPFIPCPRPRWPMPLPPGVPMPSGPRPYRIVSQSPIPAMTPPPMQCSSPEYLFSPYPPYVGVPLEPPGPLPMSDPGAYEENPSTADIIASQSQDYVDEKLAEYQATIYHLQGTISEIEMNSSYICDMRHDTHED